MLAPPESLVPCPYVVGAKFQLRISSPSRAVSDAHVTVVHTYTPFTISPVMRVSLDLVVPTSSGSYDTPPVYYPAEMILKVYDRRFAASLRAHYKGKPATYESEKAYRDYVAASPAPDLWILDEEIKAVVGPKFRYGDAPTHLFERLITLAMAPYYEDECAAYNRLAPLQGHDIPIFYGTAQLLTRLSDLDPDPSVEGVLLEVIPGFGLDKVDPMVVNVDASIRNAMRIVEAYSELGVLNTDVHLGNFIIKPDGRLVMIDFAQSRLREEHESDQEWWEDKNGEDERGCICFEAEMKYNYDWSWVPRSMYLKGVIERI